MRPAPRHPLAAALLLGLAAARAGAPRMRLRDYAHLLGAPEGRPLRTVAERRAAERRALAVAEPPGTPGARYDTLMALEALAGNAAPAAPGRFPTVVLGMGWSYESPLAQVVIAEYLASRGYLVVDLGDALLARGDRAGALAAIRRALELDPDHAEAKARLAEMGVAES